MRQKFRDNFSKISTDENNKSVKGKQAASMLSISCGDILDDTPTHPDACKAYDLYFASSNVSSQGYEEGVLNHKCLNGDDAFDWENVTVDSPLVKRVEIF